MNVVAEREAQLKHMKMLIAMLPPDERDTIETIARSFRNTLALGKPAQVAFMLVSTEMETELSKEYGL